MSGTDEKQRIDEARRLAGAGRYGDALRLLSDALPPDGPGGIEIARAVAGLAAGLVPSTYRPELDRGLVACFQAEDLDCQPLARCAASLLLLKYPGAETGPLGEDPLWIAFLTRCINTHPGMEARLTAIRDRLAAGEAAPDRALAALAVQAAAGEYVWPVVALESNGADLLSALYALPERTIDGGDPVIEVMNGAIQDRVEEKALAEAMPSLPVQGHDPVSDTVREQYEKRPYPRWRARPAPQVASLAEILRRLPRVDASVAPGGPLDILVAGCGTGFEAIELARTDPAARVTALDLSRASLAYGKRMAGALPNLDFIQGDILDAAALGRRFGLVTSTGVLHHMDRPGAGLAALGDVTMPGGILRIALYSERARQPVRAAHALIAEMELTTSDDDIRQLRARILAAPEESPLAIIRQSDDFYSLSGCRDLLFHVREHWFTPPRLRELVEGAGLKLVHFDAPPPARRAFRQMFGQEADPLDLGAWDRLEQREPFLFAGMYHLWLQKAAG